MSCMPYALVTVGQAQTSRNQDISWLWWLLRRLALVWIPRPGHFGSLGFCRVQADMIIYIYPCIHLQLHMSCIHVHYIYVFKIILLFKIYDIVIMRSYGHIILYVCKILFTQNQILRTFAHMWRNTCGGICEPYCPYRL